MLCNWRVYDAPTQLTAERDRGCDVVLYGTSNAKNNALIQCKFSEHSRRDYNSEDIVRELYSAQPHYKDALHKEFKRLLAISNARGFSRRVKKSAKSRNVTLVDQSQLKKWLKRHPVTRNEVAQKLAKERIAS